MIAVEKKAETGAGMSNKPLGVLVDVDVLNAAGFNYDRFSFSIPGERGGRYFIYVSDQFGRGISRVIIEDPRQRGAIRWREWYFGTIEGTPLEESSTDEERRGYFVKIRALVQPLNWDDGTGLQRKVEREIDRFLGGSE